MRLRSFTSRKRLDFAERCSPINRSPPRIGQLLCVGSAILLPMHICPAMPGASTWKESSRRTMETAGRTVSPRSSVRTCMPYGIRSWGGFALRRMRRRYAEIVREYIDTLEIHRYIQLYPRRTRYQTHQTRIPDPRAKTTCKQPVLASDCNSLHQPLDASIHSSRIRHRAHQSRSPSPPHLCIDTVLIRFLSPTSFFQSMAGSVVLHIVAQSPLTACGSCPCRTASCCCRCCSLALTKWPRSTKKRNHRLVRRSRPPRIFPGGRW